MTEPSSQPWVSMLPCFGSFWGVPHQENRNFVLAALACPGRLWLALAGFKNLKKPKKSQKYLLSAIFRFFSDF